MRYGGISDLTHEKCNTNILLVYLAQLYVSCPEHIILLLTNENLHRTCQDVREILIDQNCSFTEIQTSVNLYMRLYNGLVYFDDVICQQEGNFWKIYLNNYHECFRALREDLIDCEGPPDWFEKADKALVCHHYENIANCQYGKATKLCGTDAGRLLRNLSYKIMEKSVMFKCRVSRSLPQVDDDAMPDAASAAKSSFSLWDAKLLLCIDHLPCIICYLVNALLALFYIVP